jgi:hypothetical protein
MQRTTQCVPMMAILAAAVSLSCQTVEHLGLTARVDSSGVVHVQLVPPRGVALTSATIYRSTVDLSARVSLDLEGEPIVKVVLDSTQAAGEWVDSFVAHGATYWYYARAEARGEAVHAAPVAQVRTPDSALPAPNGRPLSLFVDKRNYILEVRMAGKAVKRYPVALGGAPHTRKLHYDCRSTPEGRYRVAFLKPVSSFHRSIGVSYPNQEDRRRYAQAVRNGRVPTLDGAPAPIGGSITIHGGGIGYNWTWGCVAMRNEDLDELFALKELRCGVPILITGSEVPRESLR